MPFQIIDLRQARDPARQFYEYPINPTLVYNLDRLRNGLEMTCGRNNFIVYGDIMQLTIRVETYQNQNLIAQLQTQGALRHQATEELPQAVRHAIMRNGWYQIQPHDRE
ncbi:hypothetical protein FPSE_05257 [Fusarium pseudograminearum CS3096]|uniref:Uncharacterized protein n=1 Tax=Fusarium pseudograminearum (strain CS3096) TaxID=1028729 RepID=K3VIT7_FUSPC|nr:hypothetical protein FPSE_05257 [Fusarium pseudograminearum CS3096]EKJ74507.1 hypothetical protein FPSE_05257 [Fusarium pseudograminearum CS3096]